MDEDWGQYIKQKHTEYKKIGQIDCPAFPNEKVHFNKYGFNHLVWKGKNPRTKEEQQERLDLLPFVINVISNGKNISEYRKIIRGNSKVCFWAIKERGGEIVLRVVLRKKNDGLLHFFSIYV
jgi:hypothetical protein